MLPKIKTFNNKYENPKFSFVAIIILTGSIFENNHEKGISHFIEHLLFKGSKYSNNLKNLNNKLNSAGMLVNAFTTPFITCFHLSCPTSKINEAINTLVQIVFNPLFRQEDINKERKVVINELMERTTNPEAMASIQAQQTMYTQNNPLHHPVIGYVDVLKNIDRDTILAYYHKFYQPKNMIFFSNTSKNKNSISKMWENAFKKNSLICPPIPILTPPQPYKYSNHSKIISLPPANKEHSTSPNNSLITPPSTSLSSTSSPI